MEKTHEAFQPPEPRTEKIVGSENSVNLLIGCVESDRNVCCFVWPYKLGDCLWFDVCETGLLVETYYLCPKRPAWHMR